MWQQLFVIWVQKMTQMYTRMRCTDWTSSEPGMCRLYSTLSFGLAILRDSMQPSSPSLIPRFALILRFIHKNAHTTVNTPCHARKSFNQRRCQCVFTANAQIIEVKSQIDQGYPTFFDRRAKCTNFKLVAGQISNFTTNKTPKKISGGGGGSHPKPEVELVS